MATPPADIPQGSFTFTDVDGAALTVRHALPTAGFGKRAGEPENFSFEVFDGVFYANSANLSREAAVVLRDWLNKRLGA